MGNSKNKRDSATVHNVTNDLMNNTLFIGTYHCDKVGYGNLLMFLKSESGRELNIYCNGMKKDCETCEKLFNFKRIDEEPKIHLEFPPSDITRTLVEAYGEDRIEELLGPEAQ